MEKYLDKSLSMESRIDELLKRMTVNEKIGQLYIPMAGWNAVEIKNGEIEISEKYQDFIKNMGIGMIYGITRSCPWTQKSIETGINPIDGIRAVNLIQKFAISNSRLGIPIMFAGETNHGHMAIGATVFPTPIGLSCSFDKKLVYDVSRAIAVETRAAGDHLTYAPDLDIAQDPRWSRVEETFGEDPYLVGELGETVVKAYKGNGFDSDSSIMATIKHFAAHGCPHGGLNCAPTHIGERELHDVMLPPFKKAIDAGAISVVAAYSEIDGVPCTANDKLLNGILKNDWGFKGFVISDGGSIEMLATEHGIAENVEAAAQMAVKNGIDCCLWGESFELLYDLVEKGKIDISYIDNAVRRVLRAKFMLGLFENPFINEDNVKWIRCEAHKKLAKKSSDESIVLLKNTGILPLKNDVKKIAVIGPNADAYYNQLGDYTAPQEYGDIVTVYKAFQGSGFEITYAKGCMIKENESDNIAEAVKSTEDADVVVMVLGGSSARYNDTKLPGGYYIDEIESGENFDRSDINLSGKQLELFRNIKKTGKQIITVIISGRPLDITEVSENSDALLYAFYPGEQGGQSVVDIILGKVNPCGKLSISIPKSTGQIPVYYNKKPSAHRNYVFMDSKPLYSFGYGLSYTSFKYSNIRLSSNIVKVNEYVTVEVDVKNVGNIKGKEIVQLYIRDKVATVTRPLKELKGFEKIELEPDETKPVKFIIEYEQLSLIDINMNRVVEKGEFTVFCGGNLDDLISVDFKVV